LNQQEFLESNRISQDVWEKANIEFEQLKKIKTDYENKVAHLTESAEFLARMLQRCDYVHSVRWRVKESSHVLEKIVRKRAEHNIKYEHISVDNYFTLITDLVGIRVLHLFKHEWIGIHDYIKSCWEPEEQVVAYIREGDEGDVIESYKKNNCEVKVHPAGYRSVHFIISTQPTMQKVLSEIQVRTIFEEGWSEIDHKVRYPNFMDNELVSYFLTIFNRMSGSADEMGTFVNNLVNHIKWGEIELDAKQKEQEQHLARIEELGHELLKQKTVNKTHETNVKRLNTEIASLRENANSARAQNMYFSRFDDIEKFASRSYDQIKAMHSSPKNQLKLDLLKSSLNNSVTEEFAKVVNHSINADTTSSIEKAARELIASESKKNKK